MSGGRRLTSYNVSFDYRTSVLNLDVMPGEALWMAAGSAVALALRRPRAHSTAMAKDPKPTFKPRPYKDGSGYLVEAEWPDGVIQLVDDFGSESEALEWIAEKSDDWVRKHPKPA
jgi:hypothetical protein